MANEGKIQVTLGVILLNHLGDGKLQTNQEFQNQALLNHLGDGKHTYIPLDSEILLLNHLGDGKHDFKFIF